MGQVMMESKGTKVNKVDILLLRSEDTSNHSNTQTRCWVDQKLHSGFSIAAYRKCERTYWPITGGAGANWGGKMTFWEGSLRTRKPSTWRRSTDDSTVSNQGHGKNGCIWAKSKDGRNGEDNVTVKEGLNGAYVHRHQRSKPVRLYALPNVSERNGNPPQYSCLEIPWTERPGRLQPMGSQE